MTDKPQNGGERLEELIRLAQGKVESAEREAIERRIAADQKLAALYKVIQLLVETKDQIVSTDIARVASRLGLQIFRDFRKQSHHPGSKQAITLFDSREMQLPQGVRPAAVDTRRLKFQLPVGLVELAVYPVSFESFEIVGMISDHEASTPYTVVVITGRRELRFDSDEVNLFRIPRISRGKHELKLYSDQKLIGTIAIEL